VRSCACARATTRTCDPAHQPARRRPDVAAETARWRAAAVRREFVVETELSRRRLRFPAWPTTLLDQTYRVTAACCRFSACSGAPAPKPNLGCGALRLHSSLSGWSSEDGRNAMVSCGWALESWVDEGPLPKRRRRPQTDLPRRHQRRPGLDPHPELDCGAARVQDPLRRPRPRRNLTPTPRQPSTRTSELRQAQPPTQLVGHPREPSPWVGTPS
jgi:hypothetical protein